MNEIFKGLVDPQLASSEYYIRASEERLRIGAGQSMSGPEVTDKGAHVEAELNHEASEENERLFEALMRVAHEKNQEQYPPLQISQSSEELWPVKAPTSSYWVPDPLGSFEY
jgi:hypothetical protein